MASINLDKVRDLYGNSTDLQGQFIDYLRNVESELDFSKFEGLDDQAIFTNLMESGQKEIKVNPNNPAKPLDYRPRREQTYKELKVLDDEIKNQPFYKDLAMRATQVLDQINPTPFRQKDLETRRHKAQEILNHLKKSGVTSEQFAKEYGDSPFLREAYFENQDIFSNIFDLSHDTSAALFGGKNAQAQAYDFELESYNTYKTIAQRKLNDPSNYYKITPQERAIIERGVGAIGSWWRNNSDKELVDYYLDLENAKESASNFVAAQKRLENVNSNEQFLGLIGALKHGKEFDKKQKAMIDDYAIVAKELGFDTLAYNKTGLYFIKDEKAYKVEQGLWDEIKGVFKDNIGSLAGAIAGAEYGYKKGKFKGMVAYGAAGAFGGGVTDSMIADVLANKKIDLAQALLHGAQEGALNIAADAVLKVAGTAIKTLNPEKLKNIAGTAIDYTPLLGFAKRAKDGNKAAAQKLIDHAIPQEAQADLKALESIFGAEVQIGTTKTSQAQNAINALQNKLGSDSYIVRGAQSLYNTFAFTSQKQAQKDFIRAIRADESGNLTAFLSEAANASPVIQKNLLNILNQTSQKLAHQLERFELPPSTIKDVFDNFEKGTKQSYTDAIEQILLKVYDESYTTTLAKDSPNIPSNLSEQEAARFNTDSLESFKAKMEKSGVMLEDSAKFLRFVESTIYNPKGVTFETLNNAQKTLNTYYKQASDPNFRSFVKDAVNGFIKRDIQAGIEKIFAQNAPLYNDARTLFDTALSDYAKMKETLKLADSLKIRDRRRSYEQVAQSLSRFFLGQGENIPNFEALLGSLQKELREQVELKLLQDMLELSFVKLNDIKVLDSSEFFKRLEPLKGHFHSTSAKDFIKIAQDFHTLFRNDANIAKSLSPATTEKIGTSIATTLEGAVRFQVIKALFTNIIRLMPHIPFAKRLNESVQGSALRYQLKKALDSSLSVGEFKLELQARAIKADFNNATREQIAKILGQVESAQESLERAPAQPPLRADEIGEAKQGEAADSLAIHKTDIQETQAPKDTEKGYIVRDFEIPPTPAETQAQKVDSTLESQATKEPSPSPLEQAQAQKQAEQQAQEIIKQAKEQGKSAAETAENNTNAWQKEFIEKIKNDESGEILGYYTQGEALVIERKINDKDLNLISITKGENGEPFATYLGKSITQQEAQKRKSFLDNGFKGKEKELLEFLEKEPVNIGDERIAFIPSLAKFFGIPSFNGEYFTEFFIHKHFADSKEPFTSMSSDQRKLKTAKDNLDRYIDKLFKDNGHPFGFLINNKKTMQRLAKDKELYKVKSKGAIETLLTAKMGHIQGAFHRKELGDIDLVWGNEKIGLQKIVEKHLGDFADFGSGEAGIIKGISEIVEKGKLITENGVNTIWYKNGDDYYLVGISKGFNKQGDNNWIITSYKKTKGKIPDEIKGDTANLSAYSDEFNPLLTSKDEPLNSSSNSTTLSPLEQAQAQKQAKKAEQEAAKQAQAQADQNTAQAIKDKNDQIQHLKDSRAGKSEMEREVQLGQPIAMKRTEQPPTSIATDDNNIYQLDFVIVKAHDVKPNFNADGLQPRTQKEHKTIESIARDFKPEMVLGRGGYKDLPIIAKDGQVITGNHRVQGFKDFTRESRTAYEKAIKDRFNIELASDELLLRTPSDDLSVKELLSIAYNSNKEDIKNLGDHIYSVLGRYAPNFAKLPRQLESSSVQELKSKIARILDPSPYPNENDANLALLANTIKADKNANITEMLNAFSKLDKEDAARTLNTFTDTAGLWHILSNNAVEYGLKQLDLRPYLLGAMYKSATSQNTTRAANFKELNAQIKHILDTTDSSGSNAMLLMLPNTYDNLIADLLGASLARFMRLENPSANLYETLKGANSGIREQLAPRLDFETGYTTGRNIEQADIFDFIEYMIRQGEVGKEVNEAVELLPKLREKYNAFKASTTPTPPSTPPKPTLESQAGKEASTEPPAQKVETNLSQEIKDTPKKSQREQVKQQLQSIKNIDIPHKSGIVARLSSTGIDKMLSDKAIQKSLDNGFTKEQHFNAVADIERLFKNSDFSHTESPKNQSADIVGIHRYINTQDLQDQNAQALITLKESVENGNRIYSVELEGLAHPSNLDRSPKSKGVENSHHDDAGATESARLFENPSDIIPQSHTALSKQAQDHAHQILQGLRKTAQTPLNKLADEVHSIDRKFMLREARYIKQQAQEFADNFANLRWQDLRAAIRYAKVPYDEAMFKELKESIESGEFARFIERSYPPKPSQKSLFDTQGHTPPKVETSDLNTYTDTKGHTHQIPADIAQQWFKTFGLKDLQEAYTPQFSEQVAKALEPILQGESIKLYAGSLIKLIKENRLQYLDRIKPTLEQPQRVILQNDGALIFARDFGGEKYFTSVARNDDGEWIIRSNAPKSESGLDNKIVAGGREIYNSQAATQINAHSPYDDIAKSNTKLDSDTIPQKSLMDYALLDNNLVEVIGQKIFHNYNKPYRERMSEIREFFTLPKEHFTKILDKYKREVNSLEKGEIYNKIATTMSIDEITDEITRSLKIKREKGYAAQAEKYFNELEEKAFHISKMLQDMPYQIRDFIQNSAIDYKAAQWQKLLNTLDRLITRNNERILENVQIRHKEYVEKFKNLATRNFSLWKNINALLNKEGIREVGDTLEVRNKNALDSIFKQTTPPSTPTPPHTPKVDSSVESTPPKDTLESTSTHTPSQPPQAQRLKEALQIPITDDRGLQSLAFGRVGSDAEIMEQVLIPQARNAYRKGTSQNKLEVSARNTLKKHRQDLEQSLNITPIKEFGTNYAEHYHSGESAIQKLLLEKQGQVAGAFYREGIGDITLAWGEKGTGKSDGWGLSKIVEYHPEVLDKLDKLIQDLPIVRETENRYKLDNGDFFISIRKDFEGQKQNWVLTALERDESIARRRTDLPSSQSEAEKTTSANATSDSTTKTFNQADIKLESLSDFSKFARLAGFGDLSEQELERAHKHILANLEKLRC